VTRVVLVLYQELLLLRRRQQSWMPVHTQLLLHSKGYKHHRQRQHQLHSDKLRPAGAKAPSFVAAAVVDDVVVVVVVVDHRHKGSDRTAAAAAAAESLVLHPHFDVDTSYNIFNSTALAVGCYCLLLSPCGAFYAMAIVCCELERENITKKSPRKTTAK
jgi:hypothetical protein